MVWWFLWSAFLVGIFVIYILFSQQRSRSGSAFPAESPAWLAALGPLVASAIIRWIVLPRQKLAQQALSFFVIGISLAEATCFLGLFVFRPHHQTLFLLSVIGIFQFIPTFARRLLESENFNDRN